MKTISIVRSAVVCAFAAAVAFGPIAVLDAEAQTRSYTDSSTSISKIDPYIDGGGKGVPELDPGSAATALTVLIGAGYMARDRMRRKDR